MPTIITADRLINAGHSLEQPVVVVEDGVITRIGTRRDMEVPAGEQLDFPGGTLLPSYFDIPSTAARTTM
jgi:imidazolonepropionase-like amidohydrolase